MTGGTVAKGAAVVVGGIGDNVGVGAVVRVPGRAKVAVAGTGEGVAVLVMVTCVTGGSVAPGGEAAQAVNARTTAANISLAAHRPITTMLKTQQ
jgi:hypothetical protein